MPTNRGHAVYNEHRAITEFIERMFSGFVMDYDNAAARSRGDNIAVVVPRAASSKTPAAAVVRTPDDHTPFDVDVLATISGPRVYPLPNSPTGWKETSHGVRVAFGDNLHDPARPDGLIEDALGLGTDDERRQVISRS